METVSDRNTKMTVDAAPGLLQRISHFLGMDRAILFSLLNTVRGLIGGPLVALLITLHFTPVVQGFYYTFSSVLALQVFAELGLSTILLQFSAYEWVGLSYGKNGVVGPTDNVSRLADILRFAIRWYGVAALIAATGMTIAGIIFFSRQAHPDVSWLMPWCCLCGLTGAKLLTTPLFSILEGCGQIRSTYAYRLIDGVATLLVTAVAIFTGAELWTAVCSTLTTLTTSGVFLCMRYRCFFRSLLEAPSTVRLDWRTEIFPMQWRIALGWLSGYFAFQLFTPVLFYYAGPEVAGRMGLTMSIVSIIGGIGSAWITTRTPVFASLAARKDIAAMDRLARKTVQDVMCVGLAGSCLVALGWILVRALMPLFLERLLDPASISALVLASLGLAVPSVCGVYLRAFKKELLLGVTLTYSAAVAVVVFVSGILGSTRAMCLAYCAVVFLVGCPLTLRVLFGYRRQLLS